MDLHTNIRKIAKRYIEDEESFNDFNKDLDVLLSEEFKNSDKLELIKKETLLLEQLESLSKTITTIKDLKNEVDNVPFIRKKSVWRGKVTFNKWAQLIYYKNGRYVTENARGIKIHEKELSDQPQIIYYKRSVLDLILSKDKKSRDMGEIILTEHYNAQ